MLWTLLTYFGGVESQSEDKSFIRWQIISKIFTAGVLAGQNPPSIISSLPNESHLIACGKEIGALVSLLAKGALDCLPGVDSLMVNLVRRSLALQTDKYQNCQGNNFDCELSARSKMSYKNTVNYLWKATNPYKIAGSGFPVFQYEPVSGSLSQGSSTTHEEICELLLPSSLIVRRCLELLVAWTERIPAKKIRMARLSRSVNLLLKDLTEQASQFEESILDGETRHDHNTAFEIIFSGSEVKATRKAADRRATFLREAAAYLRSSFDFLISRYSKSDSESDSFNRMGKSLELEVKLTL